jgi:hypothetical protein
VHLDVNEDPEREKVMRNRIVVLGFVVWLGASAFAVSGSAQGNNQPPSNAAITFASDTADLLLNTLFAALLQEFAETTPANVEQGKRSIGLVFSDEHTNFRLVGTQDPLSDNDLPMDTFEDAALGLALTGEAFTTVERVRGKWFYRRSIPLSNFHPACSLCHTNFGPVDPTQWVGALMLKVPIDRN